MAGLELTATPFTYKLPVVPDSVTATCVHTLLGSAAVLTMVCSPTGPQIEIPKCKTPLAPKGERNKYLFVAGPKSKMRCCQLLPPFQYTQAAMVQSVKPSRRPLGRLT